VQSKRPTATDAGGLSARRPPKYAPSGDIPAHWRRSVKIPLVDRADRRRKVNEWRALVRRVSDLLYDHDPLGMGSSVGAPSDEYDHIAIDLIRQIRDGQEIGEATLGLLPDANQSLISAITDLLAAQRLW